ncbi:hypothetical protein [Streptomyces rochei]|uniref:hypothetical protein n=1 Tax=Streptomyces rochei TaxID=1928 RepID=UPI0036BE6797
MATISLSTLAPYTDDIAFAAEEEPATTVQDFIEQLGTAAHNLGNLARINGAEDLETAAQYLSDALDSEGAEHEVLVKRAVRYLKSTADMVDEYRLMV